VCFWYRDCNPMGTGHELLVSRSVDRHIGGGTGHHDSRETATKKQVDGDVEIG
jgi:hypothetical protein